MTKSRQSAIKLRLSRLVKVLIALGCVKLAIMGAALVDLPWHSSEPTPPPAAVTEPVVQQAPTPTVAEAQTRPLQEETPKVETPLLTGPMPQGSAAAELAALARPRRAATGASPSLPAPLVASGYASPTAEAVPVAPLLPTPPRLEAPLARAGISLPEQAVSSQMPADGEWNFLALTSLPIPGLGSAQVAHAAALDMPVPRVQAQAASPFAPAAQNVPGQPVVLPGAPPLPAGIPNGQGLDGAPLPPRQSAVDLGASPAQPPVTRLAQPPAPQINAQPPMMQPTASAQELARQQQDVMILRQQMDQRLKELQSAESKMQEILRSAQETEDKQIKSLVLMYANMKPRTAAQALENMDERVAVQILANLAPKQSGEILTYTNPAKTAKFTEMLTRLHTPK